MAWKLAQVVFCVAVMVYDQCFAVLQGQHVLLAGAVAANGVNAVRQPGLRRGRYPARRRLLGPDNREPELQPSRKQAERLMRRLRGSG